MKKIIIIFVLIFAVNIPFLYAQYGDYYDGKNSYSYGDMPSPKKSSRKKYENKNPMCNFKIRTFDTMIKAIKIKLNRHHFVLLKVPFSLKGSMHFCNLHIQFASSLVCFYQKNLLYILSNQILLF